MSIDNKLISIPFAQNAGDTWKYSIPNSLTSGDDSNKASYETGFPPVTMTPIEAGGIPFYGQDVNGILNEITTAIRYIQAGNPITYNSDFATSIGGYAINSIILGSDGKFYQAIKDSVTTDPVSDKTNWKLWLNFLPITGGTLSNDLIIQKDGAALNLVNKSNNGMMIRAETSGNVSFNSSTDGAIEVKWFYDKTLNRLLFVNLTDVLIDYKSVLKTGDYGIGKRNILTNIDLFGLNGFGFSTLTTTGNKPFKYCEIIQLGNGDSEGVQIAFNLQANQAKIRTGNAKTWREWLDLITPANVADYMTQNLEYWYVNGSESSPATITTNQEIILSNPYAEKAVLLIPQAYITGRDGISRWIDCPFNFEAGYSQGIGVNQIDSYVFITGADSAIIYSNKNEVGIPTDLLPTKYILSAPFRLKIIK